MSNFNYLLEERRAHLCCRRETQNECYWIPLTVRASVAGNVNICMYCRRCEVREDIFLNEQEYKTQERLIKKEVEGE
jgi:hypothetical protein